MRQIILFLKNNKDFLTFFVFCVISFVFIFSSNSYSRVSYIRSSGVLFGELHQINDNIEGYLHLQKENDRLTQQNERLLNDLYKLKNRDMGSSKRKESFEFLGLRYDFLRGELVKNSIGNTKNYLIINRGTRDSVYRDMGVISSQGVIGIIDNAGYRFSTVMSVLNRLSRLSVSLKRTGDYGTLSWDGKEVNVVQLIDIADTAPIRIGDSIVTDTRSTIFPKGVPVGKVLRVKKNPRDKSLVVDVELFTHMEGVSRVYIIRNRDARELDSLEVKIKKEVKNE